MNIVDCWKADVMGPTLRRAFSKAGGVSVARVFGEYQTLDWWLTYNKDAAKLISEQPKLVEICEQNAGFYASENYAQELHYFLETYLESVRNADLVYVVRKLDQNNTKGEVIGESFLRGFQENYYLWSAYFLRQWFPLLEGKKVLVCSPFKQTILAQWPKRDQLFSKDIVHPHHGRIVYPSFDLEVVQTHNTIRGNTPFPCSNWRESLDEMFSKIAKSDFDIALLGCGSYGSPLCERIRKLGKKAFYLGSWCQYLFGIKGKRWENAGNPANLWFNDSWVRPSADETPRSFMKVEDGCYW